MTSLSHVVSAAPSCSGGGLLTLCPCSSMRSLSWETVPHKLLQRESFPQAEALHKLLQRGSSTGSQALPANLLQHGLLSPQVRRSWQERAPARSPHGVTASLRYPPALVWGPPWAAGGDLLHRGPPWTAGKQPASPWSCITSCKGRLCSGVSSTSSPLLLH